MTRPKIVIMGAGLGGAVAAFELRHTLRDKADVTVVSDTETFSFVPSNPWVAVRWRKPGQVQVHLPPVFARHGIGFSAAGAKRLHPAENRVELGDGSSLDYDYLVIATGPELAFDEIEGLGPDGHTVSICQTNHASAAADAFDRFVEKPGPVVIGAVQGASCYGPAYEFAMIVDAELRRRRIRDRVPITFVTAEPYIGHLGLDGVGDTKSLLEGKLRGRDVKWITNARVSSVEKGLMHVEEVAADGSVSARHDLPFEFAMMLPAFRGIAALRGIDGLVNPRGFVTVDSRQRNAAFPNIFALGVCIAIPPSGPTPVPVGVPKTGFMIESMVTAVARNIGQLIDGVEPTNEASWNAVCLADFGDGGVAFVAQPQIPPRNVNWSASGRWVHLAKVLFERYFIRKVRRGSPEPFYERMVLHMLGIEKIKRAAPRPVGPDRG
ncbi:FAD/NAD(P)-binding oxidoreductase [Sphingosinicella sp. GR2756]|uniref:FAD/NAD(P)-binding oxidoreductase n=2 Tax=Sphingosinicella rhizophila TaxID=3050082 RepID=A0ABU3Q6I3_9SPHN|nr:FAD/NAD(P)-binding oxidoreductase [Sphingosinicella sp. GR2756]MDT9599013.1 FAD/NAD(P)-binding oxidoreductase [Sphingosinicella sp. GR2756]